MKARIWISLDRTGFSRDKLNIRVTAETPKEQARLWETFINTSLDGERNRRGIEFSIGSSRSNEKAKSLKLTIEQ